MIILKLYHASRMHKNKMWISKAARYLAAVSDRETN